MFLFEISRKSEKFWNKNFIENLKILHDIFLENNELMMHNGKIIVNIFLILIDFDNQKLRDK
jgi:hypothetical protein